MPLIALLQSGLGSTLDQSPLLAALTMFGAGVLTSLTPCVYPMIPITAGVIAGTAGGSSGDGASTGDDASVATASSGIAGRSGLMPPPRRRVVLLTLTYVLGLALLYAVLGLIAGLSGTLFGTVSASPWARFATGNLLLIFGLAMLDVIPVRAPQALMSWVSGLGAGSYPAVFLLGATSGIVAAPCGAPAFAAVLTWVSTTGSALLGFVYLFIFSLGMTALLVVVGIFSGTLARLPRSGRWMIWIKRIAGVILIAMAEYYFIQMGMVW